MMINQVLHTPENHYKISKYGMGTQVRNMKIAIFKFAVLWVFSTNLFFPFWLSLKVELFLKMQNSAIYLEKWEDGKMLLW